MDGSVPLYPLQFEPIFKSTLWGGQRLRPMLRRPDSSDEPIGEAWILSDEGDSLSRVTEGPLAGQTLRDLIETYGERLLGSSRLPGGRFPLLLKLLEARKPLSVQVHPDDEQAASMTGNPTAQGKTEAWVILEAEADSQLYAGLRAGTDEGKLRRSLDDNTAANLLHTFHPQPGDCVFLEAGTVHAIGAGLLLFEVQQTSDITYRLYDWGRVDARTGEPRQLHVSESLACTDFQRGPCKPVAPEQSHEGTLSRERLVQCDYFTLDRLRSDAPFLVGETGEAHVLVCVGGSGTLRVRGAEYVIGFGDVFMLPAEVDLCEVHPVGDICLLECGLPRTETALLGKPTNVPLRRAG